MARHREEEREHHRTRTIVQRVVVPVERVYDRARRRIEHMSGTSALKYLAVSAAAGAAAHFAEKGLKRLIPSHDPLWVSVPVAAASIVAATQLSGYWQVGAFGAAVDSTGQLVSDAYHHFKRPSDGSERQQLPAQQQERRNATADQLAAAYEAARRELAAQHVNAHAQQQAAMFGAPTY
jgi:hypothetical protein